MTLYFHFDVRYLCFPKKLGGISSNLRCRCKTVNHSTQKTEQNTKTFNNVSCKSTTSNQLQFNVYILNMRRRRVHQYWVGANCCNCGRILGHTCRWLLVTRFLRWKSIISSYSLHHRKTQTKKRICFRRTGRVRFFHVTNQLQSSIPFSSTFLDSHHAAFSFSIIFGHFFPSITHFLANPRNIRVRKDLRRQI